MHPYRYIELWDDVVDAGRIRREYVSLAPVSGLPGDSAARVARVLEPPEAASDVAAPDVSTPSPYVVPATAPTKDDGQGLSRPCLFVSSHWLATEMPSGACIALWLISS